MPLPTKTDAEHLAGELRRRGLSEPAAFLIEAHRPLLPLVRQGAIFAAPLLGPLLGSARMGSLMAYLERPETLDRLLDDLRGDNGDAAGKR